MRQIQVLAVELFDEHGFDQVTIEEIASRAEVSASSVYRYFGTKEGILIHDEYEEPLMTSLLQLLDRHDLYDAAELALQSIAQDHFQLDEDLTLRRGRYFFEVPSVRAGVYFRMDQAASKIVEALLASERVPRPDPLQAHVAVNALLWGLFAAVEHVIVGTSDVPFEVALQRSLEMVRPQPTNAGQQANVRPPH